MIKIHFFYLKSGLVVSMQLSEDIKMDHEELKIK
jgi:hypothetical protein